MDFSALSDDQLLQLLKLVMQEALNRRGAAKAAAEAEVISTQEKAEIERKVAQEMLRKKAESERLRIQFEAKTKFEAEAIKNKVQATEQKWSCKSAIATVIKEWGYNGKFELNIWRSGADRRVYFQLDRRGTWKFCLYLTGNSYHPPMDFEGEGSDCWFDDKQAQLKELLKLVAQHWKGDLKMSSDVGDIAPNEKKLNEYREILNLKGVTANV